MKLAPWSATVAMAGAILLGVACGRSAPRGENLTPSVAVTIAPHRFLVERLAGGRVQVEQLVEPGQAPEVYEPKPAQLRRFTNCAVYFMAGLDRERAWADRMKAVNPGVKVVDLSSGVDLIRADELEHHDHDHGHTEPFDPHTWVSPRSIRQQAQVVAGVLSKLLPEWEAEIGSNLRGFLEEVEVLDAELGAVLDRATVRTFMVYHPAWAYFARDYGLVMVPVEVEGGEPSAAELAASILAARRSGVSIVFAQPEFNPAAAEAVARAIGGRVEQVSPLAEDWPDNLRRLARLIASQGGDSP